MEHKKLNFVERDDSIFAGAIFMSNRETKLECLQRKLFGLPLSKSKFLKQVKSGMILFLFEHEERKLYGVFEATSDGALNIIPDAFRSTGQSYPAQILFKRIWMCKPLCEDEFCSAIEENYYSPNKFHFGLSYKQVIKLIHLFYSRKINIKQYKGLGIPNKIMEKFEQTAEEDVSLTETETYFKCRSDEYEYGGEGRREVRRQLAPPQVSFDPPMPYKRPASTTSMLHTVNLPPFSYPHNSYSETLNPQRCSVCLSHDHSTFRHFSIGKQPSSTSEIEYEPLPFRSIEKQPSTACEIEYEPPPFRSIGKQPSTACDIEYEPPPFRSIGKQPSTACEIEYEPPPFRSIRKQPSSACEIEYEPFPLRPIGKQPSTTLDIEYEPLPLHSYYTPNFDHTMAPNSISTNRRSSPNNVPRELRCNDKDAFAPSPFTNNSRPQTEILQHSYASGAQPNQGFKFSDYIPLAEELRHKLDNSSLRNSEYIPSSRLNSYIPSTSREASKYFYRADEYSDDNELKTRRRVEADEYNAVRRTLHADSDSSRNTVFSRLSRHQDICNDESPEPSSGEPSGGLSLDHFLNILSTRRNLWSSAAASKPPMERNSHDFTARFHHRTGTVMSEVDRHDDDDGLTDAEPRNDVLDEESFEIPFYNFRRRNTIQKCEAQDCSNKCSEAKVMESKRRRIVRPSLKAEAEVKTFAQSEEITEVETSVKNASEFSVVDSFVDGVVPASQTVRKCEPVGESLEPSHVTSMDESLDYIPID